MENNSKFLPIGTVVMLKEGKKRVMITGFLSMAGEEKKQKVYDYSGCIYPEGFLSSNQVCLFNHEQIETVYFKGFVDEEETNFKNKLNELANSLEKDKIIVNLQNKTEEDINQIDSL